MLVKQQIFLLHLLRFVAINQEVKERMEYNSNGLMIIREDTFKLRKVERKEIHMSYKS